MSLFRSASTVSLLTLASRVTGLVRDWLMNATFGASAMTDAFWVAFRIPNMLRRLFAEGAFSQAFVPVLAASKEEHGEAPTRVLIDAVASLLCAAMVLVCLVGVAGAPLLVLALGSGLQGQSFDGAVLMTRWMFPYIACMSMVALGAGVLNTWRQFAIPAFTPVLLNVAMIAAAWVGAPWFAQQGHQPIYAMAAGVMVGGVLQLGAMGLGLRRHGLTPRIRLGFSALRTAWQLQPTRRILRLMAPALLGVGVAQFSLLINTQIATHLAVGSVTWLNSASLMMEFPTALLGVALGVVLLPQLAQARAAHDGPHFSALLDWGLRLVLVLAAPCALALLLFATPLVAVLFHYGAYGVTDVLRTSAALQGYGVGLLGLIAVKVLAPAFFARQDVRTPARIALVVLLVTQAFNLVLVPVLAHAALAWSLSLGALLNAAWLLWGLVRRGHYQPGAGWWALGGKVALACTALGAFLVWASSAVAWMVLQIHPWQRIGLLALVVIGSIAIYVIAITALGVPWRNWVKR